MTEKPPALLKDAVEKMPLVRDLVRSLLRGGFHFPHNFLVFGTQHLMQQALGLCWAFHALGARYDHIALCGKPYSTSSQAQRELEALGVLIPAARPYSLYRSQADEQLDDLKALARRFSAAKARLKTAPVVVLDDGGHALNSYMNLVPPPWGPLAGVEQTSSGFWQTGSLSLPFSVIDVGASTVKRLCEPKLIVDAALARVHKSCDLAGKRCGVIGLGFLGKQLTTTLLSQGIEVMVWDERSDPYHGLYGSRARRVHDIIDGSDIIFGATGSDVTRTLTDDVNTRGLRKGKRTFISLSSGDDEFYTLKSLMLSAAGSRSVRLDYTVDTIPDIEAVLWASEFRILRNGFPINFDNSPTSVPLADIQGTIAALIGAVCQAMLQMRAKLIGFGRSHPRVMLDVALQQWIFERWRRLSDNTSEGLSADTIARFAHHTFVSEHSTKRTYPVSSELRCDLIEYLD